MDIEAIKNKYAGYPNIRRFIEIQADNGNDQLMRKLDRMTPTQVSALLESSLPQLEEMAGGMLRAMERAAQGLPPKE